jgi:hypothetical protein
MFDHKQTSSVFKGQRQMEIGNIKLYVTRKLHPTTSAVDLAYTLNFKLHTQQQHTLADRVAENKMFY